MAYDTTKRERIEAWPKKGTANKLKTKAKNKGVTYMTYVAQALEKAAQ